MAQATLSSPALTHILEDIQRVKIDITTRLLPHADAVPARGHREYAARQRAYINEVNTLRRAMRPRLMRLAEKITALHGENWQGNHLVVQMWMEYAHLIQTLRHNPKKGPAALYISSDNRLISCAAANYWLVQMQPDTNLALRYLDMDSRGAANICAERAALADKIGHHRLRTAHVLRHRKNPQKRFKTKKIPARMQAFSQRIVELAKTISDFRGSTLITTAEPCGLCAPAVIAAGVRHIISDAQAHAHPLSEKRHATIADARAATRDHGLTTTLVVRLYEAQTCVV